MRQSFDLFGRHFELPAVRRVGPERPLSWLAAGWRDMASNPLPALAYGLLFSLGGDFILLAGLQHPLLFVGAISGFLLIAPLLAAGLYELSRQYAAGGDPGFIGSLAGLRRSATSLAAFGLVLAAIILLWDRISTFAFAVVGGSEQGVGPFVSRLITEGQHRAFVAAWFVLGAVLAIFTFAISVVSVPMLLDRDSGFLDAILTSLRTFSLNLEAMVLWGAIIGALTLLGFATLLFGLVFIMPILGHASWHAYRELVK